MPGATFRSFAGLTVAVARRDYAEDPSIADAVEAAWREVGVTPQLTKRALELVSARPASVDGGVRPIATYVEEGLLPLRSIWSEPGESRGGANRRERPDAPADTGRSG